MLLKPHPLNDAYVRLLRARELLAKFKAQVDVYLLREYRLFKESIDARVGQPAGKTMAFIFPSTPYPVSFSVLLGEVIQHLRIALDYLVYQLAFHDSGSIQTRTQFPIVSDPALWAAACKSSLKGVSQSHIASIESLQPFNGVYWTQRLQWLSNPDKHRGPILPVYDVQQTIHNPAKAGLMSNPSGVRIDMSDPRQPSQITQQILFLISVNLDDGKPAVETLEHIEGEVTKTITSFAEDLQPKVKDT